ncbi:TIMELESS-interacting protein [Amia ocellicauda]|uniref:TIMELESS-interacting protein n=1 Tax=Amia ocellicauda TaxID=2972642 RepID=UPI003463949A
MSDPGEHYHISVPPHFQDLDEETLPPFPPPASPPSRPSAATGASSPSVTSEEDEEEGVGGRLLSQMEEKPVLHRKDSRAELDVQKLVSEKGIPALQNMLENMYFKGQGYEAENLQALLQCVQCWAEELFPQLMFEDIIKSLEEIGEHPEIQSCLKHLHQACTSRCVQTDTSGIVEHGEAGGNVGHVERSEGGEEDSCAENAALMAEFSYAAEKGHLKRKGIGAEDRKKVPGDEGIPDRHQHSCDNTETRQAQA